MIARFPAATRRNALIGEQPIMKALNMKNARNAFTLVELLVVIAIIGVLVALLLPAVQAAREAARRAQCQNKLKQLGIALHSYHGTRGELPYGSNYTKGGTATWATLILPQLEQQSLFDAIDHTVPLSHPNNAAVVETAVSAYICPSDPLAQDPILLNRGDPIGTNPESSAMLSYTGSMGPTQPNGCPMCPVDRAYPNNWCCQGCNYGSTGSPCGVEDGSTVGMFARWIRSIKFSEVSDGLSNTVMIGETLPAHSIWNGVFVVNFPLGYMTVPINVMDSDEGAHGGQTRLLWATTAGYKSLHPGGAQFCMGDGSVSFKSEAIDHYVYAAMGTRAGGLSGPPRDIPPPR